MLLGFIPRDRMPQFDTAKVAMRWTKIGHAIALDVLNVARVEFWGVGWVGTRNTHEVTAVRLASRVRTARANSSWSGVALSNEAISKTCCS